MNLPKVRTCKREHGVTLIEVTLVAALIAILTTTVVPVSLRFYTTQQQIESYQTMLSVLRGAQLKAQYNAYTTNVGVKVFPTHLVTFSGDSYTSRDTSKDWETRLPTSVSINGDDEVVFVQQQGVPSEPTTISFTYKTATTTVNVRSEGLIE